MIDKTIRVLLVDDDEDDYIMTRDLLYEIDRGSYELHWATSFEGALPYIDQKAHDVYLFDFRLGERTGVELLRETIERGCRAPIIILTGQGDKQLDMLAMKSGAADYLVKGQINAPLLERSIRYALERRRSEEDIYRMAYYDTLTSLPNRLLFRDRLSQAIGLAERHGRKAAVLFIDLDNFKRINDTFGHHMGDQLLKNIAERLKNCMRKGDSLSRQYFDNPVDTVARLGGDEFTILLSEISHSEDAAKVAQRVIDTLSQQFTLSAYEIYISASIGIAIYPHDGISIDDLLKNADAAMYHAKAEGKNNYQYYRQSMNASAFERLTLENKLRKAVDRKEFILHYQPQVEVKGGKIVGLEALVRWEQQDGTLVSPADFIPIAEETRLIIPMTEWVLQTAGTQVKKWEEMGLANIPVSVNISSQQFQHRNFISTLRKILDSTGIRARDLILEITESTIMRNTDIVFGTLYEISKLGLRLSIDDFGTGYSSLSYLKRFPLHTIKIDRSFIKEINTSPDDAAISQAIISMAHSLKIKVVAEGVETKHQFAFLCEQGCDEAQGYLFSRPMPADQMTELLKKEKNTEGSIFPAMHRGHHVARRI